MNLPNPADSVPGARLPYSQYIQSKSIFLTYNGVHISRPEYRSWLVDMVASETNREVEEVRVRHRRYHTEHEEKLYTYVIVIFNDKLRCRQELFMWENVRPDIRSFPRGVTDQVIMFLDTWPSQELISTRPKIHSENDEPLPIEVKKEEVSVKIEDASGKSVCYTMMMKMEGSRDVGNPKLVAVDAERGRGTVSVIDCSEIAHGELEKLRNLLTRSNINYINKKSYKLAFEVPGEDEVGRFMNRAKEDGWLSTILVFNLTELSKLFSDQVESLTKIARDYPATRVWILTNFIPEVETWKVYQFVLQDNLRTLVTV
ncbi:Hypothetical protein POVR2_LOCUS105 [uncultured virus]|nr:Hypothetical protein POVR2_LOCUS105 [uncultured virus]